MTCTARLHPFVLSGLLAASAWVGCGDPSSDPSGTAVTVFIPSGPNATGSFTEMAGSLEYTVACGPEFDGTSPPGKAEAIEGTFERADTVAFGTDGGLAAVWKGPVDLAPGPCMIELRLRDADNEVICTGLEQLTQDQKTPTEAYVNLVCYATCPTIPLPELETSPKTVCAPVGGVLLSAETPADLETVQSIEYVMTATNEGWLESNPPAFGFEGSLEFSGPGSADLGGGSVATDLWEATVGVVRPDRYILELRARNAEGEPVCSAQRSVEVIADRITQIHIILSCSMPTP